MFTYQNIIGPKELQFHQTYGCCKREEKRRKKRKSLRKWEVLVKMEWSKGSLWVLLSVNEVNYQLESLLKDRIKKWGAFKVHRGKIKRVGAQHEREGGYIRWMNDNLRNQLKPMSEWKMRWRVNTNEWWVNG